MNRPNSTSSRPSSTGSAHSVRSGGSKRDRGPNRKQEICIGEEVRIAICLAVERFRADESQKELEFPSSLTATERAYVHRLVESMGIKSKSRGKGANRCLTISKKEGSTMAHSSASFQLVKNSRQQINSLLQRFPLTNKERQELQPRTDRNQINEVSRELNKTTIGKLNNGVAQIPPRRGESELKGFRENLPVYKHWDEIMFCINNNQVTLISGETGSGKTTQVPQMILDESHTHGRPCRIICTQPRRIAALSVAERVAAERAERIGQTVGYQIRLESKVSPKTLLTFCTTGVLLRTLMGGGDRALTTVTHVIVDEIHERDRFSDFLLTSLREVILRYRHLKIVLMSASLNTELFVRYFNNCPVVSEQPLERKKITLEGFEIVDKDHHFMVFCDGEFLEEQIIAKFSVVSERYGDEDLNIVLPLEVTVSIQGLRITVHWINVPGSLYNVKEYFLEDVLKLTMYFSKDMDKQKQEMERAARQQKVLTDLCSKMALDGGEPDPKDDVEDFQYEDEMDDKIAQLTELGQEKEVLEPWLVKEMDQLLEEIWLSGNEDNFSQIFHLIMSENVSVDYQHSNTSLSSLMIAAGRGFTDIVEQLLNLGANVSLRASNDMTALDWAKRFNRSDIVEMLEVNMMSNDVGPGGDGIPEKESKLSEEDKELLTLYQHTFNDEKVDLNLILALIQKIISTKQDGAILIFLPGYDEIVSLRDRIDNDKFMQNHKYILYTLHSAMQSSDQKKVFRNPPSGVRKIILSTNIAETSITINDVVFVIDSGKVKEKHFDALLSVHLFKSYWISKASALQRKGRAGRCRPGVCYHLFSSIRHNTLMDYATPEILRHPLQELCLHTKLLAPINTSIAEFLAKAPEPPAFLVTRNAVQLLKQVDALDAFEDLTELGHHLADLPLDPRLGKMLLYSVVLKCLDPVLTIVCALAYKDPFLLPSQPYQKRASIAARRKFAAETFSDHMALLRAFQAWQRARTDGWEKSFCQNNFLSSACMEIIVGLRTQLLGQLRASGFVRARGGGDIRDLNTNSENWAVVKAALCAGMYPNLIFIDRKRMRILSQKEGNVKFHSTSVLTAPPTGSVKLANNLRAHNLRSIPSDWILYEEITRYERQAFVKCCTVVSPISVALFAGPGRMSPDCVKDYSKGFFKDNRPDNSSDSESEDKEELTKTSIQLDEWLNFKVDSETGNLVVNLRQKWHSLFLRRMRAPSKPWSQVDEAVIRAVINVLTSEEQALGLQQPAGIGQRPRPMNAESLMSSGSNHDYHDFDESDNRPVSRGGRRSYNTPPRKPPQFGGQRTPKGNNNTDHQFESSPGASYTSSTSGSGNNSVRSSAGSTPSGSPKLASQSNVEIDSAHPSRFFVIKCNSQKYLDISQSKGIWATNQSNEKKFNKAFQDGKAVHLIFSVQGSGHFQGYARMTSLSVKEKSPDFNLPGLNCIINVEWIKRANLPFQSTHHLLNQYNENRRVQISRDGQEIEPTVGESLIKQWDRFPNNQRKSSQSSSSSSPSQSSKSGSKQYTSSSEKFQDRSDTTPISSSSTMSKDNRKSSDSSTHDSPQSSSNSSNQYDQSSAQGHGPGSYPHSSHQGQQHYHRSNSTGHYQHHGGQSGMFSPSHGFNFNQLGHQGFNQMYMSHVNSSPGMMMASPPPVMILQRGHGSGFHGHPQYNRSHSYGSSHYQGHGGGNNK